MAYNYKTFQSGLQTECFTYEKPVTSVGRLRSAARFSKTPTVADPAVVRRAKAIVRRRVFAGLLPGVRLHFVTLTFEGEPSLAAAYKCLLAFMRNLRGFRFVGVVEFQKRGVAHFHFLVLSTFRLPLPPHEFFSQSWVHGGLWVVSSRVFKGGNASEFLRVSSYITKYMTKAYGDIRLYRRRKYFFSRDWPKPIETRGPDACEIIEDIVQNAGLPEYTAEWSTERYGHVAYAIYHGHNRLPLQKTYK